MQPFAPLPAIGFIGVGHMGGPMALNLHRAGFTVLVYDVSPQALAAAAQAGLATAGTPAEAIQDAEVSAQRRFVGR